MSIHQTVPLDFAGDLMFKVPVGPPLSALTPLTSPVLVLSVTLKNKMTRPDASVDTVTRITKLPLPVLLQLIHDVKLTTMLPELHVNLTSNAQAEDVEMLYQCALTAILPL